jgi:MFS transporter, Spinster family, sphingosine-1-phosphate transporter
MLSDANGGNLARAILDINWVAPVIVVLLLILARRASRDENLVLARARAAGEIV